MRQNLKAEHYDNTLNWGSTGTTITHKSPSSSNMSTTTPYQYYPKNNSSNVASYGLMYNWPGANGYGVYQYGGYSNMVNSQGKTQGACPRGWHIPTQTEMGTLNSNIDNGSNYTNLNPQYAGYIWTNGNHLNWDDHTDFECWSSTAYYYWWYNNSNHSHSTSSSNSAAAARSVRCVQD